MAFIAITRKEKVSKMLPFSKFHLVFLILMFMFTLTVQALATLESSSSSSSIYEVLRSHGLPMGLLPNGIKNFTFDNSGKFEVHLDQGCNSKFENEFHYDMSISGTLRYGEIGGLSGISAQDLFLWLPVKEIRVDIPSSGLIYFDVTVVSKQFPLSSFENPRDCTAAQSMDWIPFGEHIKSIVTKFQHMFDQVEFMTTVY